MHTTGSDGKLSPEEAIKLAIELDFHHICITDHYNDAPEIRKEKREFHTEKYYNEVKGLIKKYSDKIDISFGVEFNFSSKHLEWIKKEIKKRDYDYVLGSVHVISPDKKDYFNICNSKENWIKMIKEFKGVDNIIKEYYNELRLMIKSKLFDSIGHFDLIKIYEENKEFFKESNIYYKKQVLDTLDLLKKSNMVVEINSSGFRRICNEQYPSIWILKEMKKRNIPITIGTDSHRKEHFDLDLDKSIKIVKSAGYNSAIIFKKRKPIEVEI